MRHLLPILAVCWGILASCEPATAPEPATFPFCRVSGTVTLGSDQDNEGIQVVLLGTSRVSFTNEAGLFQLDEVPWDGAYTLVASKEGYQSASVEVTVPRTKAITLGPLVLQAQVAEEPPLRLITLDRHEGATLWGREPLDIEVHLPRKVTVRAQLPPGGARLTYLLTNTARYSERSLADFDPFAPARSARTSHHRRELVGLSTSGMVAWVNQKQVPGHRALSPAPSTSALGQKLIFTDALWDSAPTTVNKHPVTLKQKVTAGGRTLHLWVADAAWAKASGAPTTPKLGLTHGVTQTMVDALASRFLSDGVNDIYGWVTGLYGSEWPDSGAPPGEDGVLIDGGGNLHVFIINLNPGGTAAGTLMGYFHSLNAVVGALGSNGKVLFAIDADTLATPEGSSWDLSDEAPSEIVSTLAHEFQHMVHYYQKQVRLHLTRSTDTWIDEMASLITEDLLADKLSVPGPRGVSSADPGPGPAGNESGRVPLFNYWHEMIPLQSWLPEADVLKSYSNAYAFGAWLVRNYGGPGVLRSIVRSDQTDYRAVVSAVRQTPEGVGQTYESLVCDWGMATFLRNGTTPPFRYRSIDRGFQWTLDGRPYSAGSLDLGLFRYADGTGEFVDGPYVYEDPTAASSLVSAGATYFQTLGFREGTFSQELSLPADVALTVVAVPEGP